MPSPVAQIHANIWDYNPRQLPGGGDHRCACRNIIYLVGSPTRRPRGWYRKYWINGKEGHGRQSRISRRKLKPTSLVAPVENSHLLLAPTWGRIWQGHGIPGRTQHKPDGFKARKCCLSQIWRMGVCLFSEGHDMQRTTNSCSVCLEKKKKKENDFESQHWFVSFSFEGCHQQ